MSLPVRGAWVEIAILCQKGIDKISRSPCGERGLKCGVCDRVDCLCCVAPRAGSVG